jgi:hypothetical protein
MATSFQDELESYFQNLDELAQDHLNQDVVEFHLDDLDPMVVAVEVYRRRFRLS